METRTFDSVISALNNMVSQKQVIDPSQWVEAGQYLNLFLESEQTKLFELQQKVAQMRCDLLEVGKSVAEAKTRIEASQEYLDMQKQKAKIDRAIEMIRITKLQARMTSDILRSN